MNKFKHLQPKQYYIDLHDEITVRNLRIAEKIFSENKGENKSRRFEFLWKTAEYFKKGERYVTKENDIREWMDRDRKRDEKIENAVPLEGIFCLNCDQLMECEFIDLQTHLSGEPLLFMYRCNSCGDGRIFYDNGQEYKIKEEICSKCYSEMKKEYKREEDTVTSTCVECGYKEIYKMNSNVRERIDPDFESDRARFCLSEKEGLEYISGVERLKRVSELMEDENKNKEAYEKIRQMKRLPIAEVKKLMTEFLEKEGYIDLRFENPDIGRFLSVTFIAQDNNVGQGKYESRIRLKKIIDKLLIDTNWRLMSDGITYRLGFVSGRIRGYESDKELIDLV